MRAENEKKPFSKIQKRFHINPAQNNMKSHSVVL